MSLQRGKILLLILVLSITPVLGQIDTDTQEILESCTQQRTIQQDFEQSDVRVTVEPQQTIEREDVSVRVFDFERQRFLDFDFVRGDEESFVFQPEGTFLPNGDYRLLASLEYDVWQPTECVDFTVNSLTPTPWITEPLSQSVERSKIGIAQDDNTEFELTSDEPIECILRSSLPQEGSLSNIFNSADREDALRISDDETATLSWQRIAAIYLGGNYSAFDKAQAYFICEQTVAGEEDLYALDSHDYIFSPDPPVLDSVQGVPSIVRDPFFSDLQIQVESQTPLYCESYADNPPDLSEVQATTDDFERTKVFDIDQAIDPSQGRDIQQNFACIDLLGQQIEDNVTIEVDLSEQLFWTEPVPDAVASSSLDLSLQAANVDSCSVNGVPFEVVNEVDEEGFTIFNGTVQLSQEGRNSLNATCVNDDDEVRSVTESVILDTTPPQIRTEISEYACSLPTLSYELSEAIDEYTSVDYVNITYSFEGVWNSSEVDDSSEIGSREEVITDTITNPPVETTSFSSSNLPFEVGSVISVEVIPVDEVGNVGTTTENLVSLAAPNSPECNEPEISIDNIYYPNNNSDLIYADVECSGVADCAETFRYTVYNSRSQARQAMEGPELCGGNLQEVRNLDTYVAIDAQEDYLFLCAQVSNSVNVALDVKEYRADSPGFCRNNNFSSLTGETDVDCGGPCPGCSLGKSCNTEHDCAEGLLCGESGTCEAPPLFCQDGTFNPSEGETDVDCGGPCFGCEAGNSCQEDSDCASGICQDDLTCAAPMCNDGIRNQHEIFLDTDVGGEITNCGGPNCPQCPVQIGAECTSPRDCQGKEFVCEQQDTGVSQCSLSPEHCRNNERDGDETDVDCGGSCQPCEEGNFCVRDSDCFNNNCIDGTCEAPTCGDGRLNYGETHLDEETGYTCGGPNCDSCTVGESCESNSDCATRNCGSDGLCQAPSCTNNQRDGEQTDIDCGGPNCDSCSMFEKCNSDSDCATGYCDTTGDTVSKYDEVHYSSHADTADSRTNGVCFIDPSEDQDGDGLPDYWEYIYSDDRTGMNPEEDLDGDGFTNREEFEAGTDPTDPTDHPPRPETYVLEIILVSLGILSMGTGGGLLYYDRTLYQEEQRRQKRRQKTTNKSSKKKKKKEKKKVRERDSIMDKVKEQRDNILSTFSNPSTSKKTSSKIKKPIKKPTPKKPKSKSKAQYKKVSKPKKSKSESKAKKKDGEYVDVNTINNKEEYKDIKSLKKNQRKDTKEAEEDVFSELEDMTKDE